MPRTDALEITDIPVPEYERVARAIHRESGLHAIIAIHDRTLGPALGGMRMWNYRSEDEALTDVLRLSKGMTYKSALARTGLGGGKSVVIGDARTDKSEALFLAMGRFIESLGGAYITAEDVGTTIPDLEIVRRETKWVTGLSVASHSSGNPSPYTAIGCLVGLRAVLEAGFRTSSPRGLTFAIQGVGAVGSALARGLAKEGAKLVVADMHEDRAKAVAAEIGARHVPHETILEQECDVLAPCALGGVVNDRTIARFACKAIAGCANNQLLEPRHGDVLAERGILYAPDYVINAGGIINVSCELHDGGYREAEARRRIDAIYPTLKEIFEIAAREGTSTHRAADRLAERILAEGKKRQSNGKAR
ncbi:MAG TPA: Glu/Leu/Phe/Val dehydrogenase dimerization domain-containing protein [Planctomycetota bacterium]|nr:Glu/Leu/Phe/Val dehydrogenase dimerization domain-containing protein [Planctomycetota bacterium]